jgi:hypothetical protein
VWGGERLGQGEEIGEEGLPRVEGNFGGGGRGCYLECGDGRKPL